MSAAVATAWVEVAPSTQGMGRAISDSVGSANISAGVKRLGDNIIAAGGVVEGAGRALSTRVTAPIVAAFTAASVIGMNFSDTMTTIGTTTGMTDEAVAKLGRSFRGMAKSGDYGSFSAQQIAKAYDAVAVKGQDAQTATDIMRASMLMATATGNDLKDTAYFIGNYLLKVGKDSSYAAKYIDLFTLASANTGISLSDMQNYMFRMTPAFNQFGASTETNTAIMSRMYQAGIRGADLYSGMATVMQDFAVQGDATTAMMQRFGVAMYDSDGQARSNKDRMFDLAKAMGAYEDQVYVASMVMDNFNMTQANAWDEFMNLSEEIRNDLIPSFYGASDAYDGLGMAAGRAARNNETFAATKALFMTRIKEVAKTIFETLKPSISQAAEWVGQFGERINELNPRTVATAVKIAAVAAAIGPLLVVTGKIIKAVGMLVKGIAFMMSPMGAVILLAGALVALFTQWDNMSAGLRNALRGLVGVLSLATTYIVAKKAASIAAAYASKRLAAAEARLAAAKKGSTAATKLGIFAMAKKAAADMKSTRAADMMTKSLLGRAAASKIETAATKASTAARLKAAVATKMATAADKGNIAAKAALKIATLASGAAKAVATIAQWALNAAKYANPIGLIIAAVVAAIAVIAALVAGVIAAVNAFSRWISSSEETKNATEKLCAAQERLERAYGRQERATELVAAAQQRYTDALRGVQDAKLEMENADIALERSTLRLYDAQKEYNKIAAEFPKYSREYIDAALNLRAAKSDLEAAELRVADAAKGATEASKERERAMRYEAATNAILDHSNRELVWSYNAIDNACQNTEAVVAGTMSGIMNSFSNMASHAVDAASNVCDGVIASLEHMHNVCYGNSIIPDMTSGIISSFAEMESGATGHAGGMVSTVTSRFSDLLSNSVSTFGSLRSNVTSRLSDTLGNVTTSAGNIRDRLTSRFREGCTDAVGSFRTMGTDVNSQMASTLTDVTSQASSISTGLTTHTSEGAASVASKFGVMSTDVGSKMTATLAVVTSSASDIAAQLVGNVAQGATDTVKEFASMGAGSVSTMRGFVGDMSGVARSMVDGLTQGIRSGSRRVANQMRDLANNALRAARSALGISSPSRRMAEIGQFINRGLMRGIDSSASAPVQAMQRTIAGLNRSAERAFDGIGRAVTQLDRHIEQLSGSAQRSAKRQRDRLEQVVESLRSEVADAIRQLESAREAFDSYAQSIQNTFANFGALGSLGLEEGATAGDFIGGLQDRLRATQDFSRNVDKLRARGLNQSAIDEILNAGLEKGSQKAQALTRATNQEITQINRLQASISAQGTRLGQNLATQFKQSGVDAAQGLVDGLNSKSRQIERTARRLARSLSRELRRQLRIKSPSREFMDIGGYIMEGLGCGIQDGLKDVLSTVKDAGDAITDAFDVAATASLDVAYAGTGFTGSNYKLEPAAAGVASVTYEQNFYTPVASYYEVKAANRVTQREAARR